MNEHAAKELAARWGDGWQAVRMPSGHWALALPTVDGALTVHAWCTKYRAQFFAVRVDARSADEPAQVNVTGPLRSTPELALLGLQTTLSTSLDRVFSPMLRLRARGW